MNHVTAKELCKYESTLEVQQN